MNFRFEFTHMCSVYVASCDLASQAPSSNDIANTVVGNSKLAKFINAGPGHDPVIYNKVNFWD